MEDYIINEKNRNIYMYCAECNQISTENEVARNEDKCIYCSAYILELFPWKQISSQNPNLPKTPKKNVKYNIFQ